jgi:hypothetical protein
MSTVDPDARGRRIGQSLKGLTWPCIILGTLAGPLCAAWLWSQGPHGNFGGPFVTFILGSVGLGLVVYYLPTKRSPLAIAAYIVAYVGGLCALLGATQVSEPFDAVDFRNTFIIIGVFYAVALLLVILYIRRQLGVAYLAEHGVDTQGVVQSAGVDGMVNYVQHQRLTIKFTDQQGVDRYIRIGRTGGGYSAGDPVSVRYDPAHPSMKHRIVVS